MAYYSGPGADRDASSGYLLIGFTLFLSLTLEFFPWPGWALQIKPLFPELALIYWVINRPKIINYEAAVALGLMIDLASQAPLGFHALSYTLVVMLGNGMRGRFSLLGPAGQALHVLFVLCCGQTVLFLLELLDGGRLSHFNWRMFSPSLAAAVLWLILPLLMRRLGALLSGRSHE